MIWSNKFTSSIALESFLIEDEKPTHYEKSKT
jgi:hypothetical protein